MDYDCTTGLRFHPLEILYTFAIHLAVILLLSPPPIVVLLYELLYILATFFNHGNIHISPKIDQCLRKFLVTPDMHRIHHSIDVSETNSNYGGFFTWWDYLFHSYRAQPMAGHQQMMIGLDDIPEKVSLSLWRLLVLPFLFLWKKTTKY
jgi:sterol desaturase/sphingolipid hydroxylase (fatty acid hydroxylase superfamily)